MSEPIGKPAWRTTINGDILRRACLFRWIREFIDTSDMPTGYYMEFGVLNGECMMDAYRQLRGVISHWYGFDSFAGLPKLSREDRDSAGLCPIFYEGNFKSMSRESVQNTILASCRM